MTLTITCSKVPSSHFSDFNVKWVAFFLSKIKLKHTENNFVPMFVTNLLHKVKIWEILK